MAIPTPSRGEVVGREVYNKYNICLTLNAPTFAVGQVLASNYDSNLAVHDTNPQCHVVTNAVRPSHCRRVQAADSASIREP